MQQCPQESTLTDLLSGVLAEEQRVQVLAHVEACESCRWALAAGGGTATQVTGSPPSGKPSPFRALAPGTQVSRYIVREKLGAGAMGVVYAADDPELGRRVALKMLHPEGSHKSKLQQRLLREAQALARLSHPNVVTLYDVGTHGDGIFLAMELIEGVTLGEWMRRRHPWEEVLQVFLDAGKGLEAAHSAGLVHRDFKPANILMGNDGRVFVTDFGIARSLNPNPEEDSESADPIEVMAQPADPLTLTGQILGTPAYLAPELVQGQRGDARSDEFSFCVALHEALFGERPFRGSTLQELAEAARQGKVSPPKNRGNVPTHIQRAIRQGLSARPEDRFPTMRALLAALAPPPRRKHARILGTLLLASVVGAVVAYGVTLRQRETTCVMEAEKSLVAWSPERREQVHAAFLATGESYAPRAWSELSMFLDAYTAQWRALRTEACVAAKSKDALEAQRTSACLDALLWQLAATTEVLQKADATTVQNTRQLTSSFKSLTSCSDTQASSRPQPPDGLRRQVDAVRNKLAQVRAHHLANRLAEGLELSSALLDEQKAIGYKPLEAEVTFAHGRLLDFIGRQKEAIPFLYQSLWAAETARDDESAARAWVELLALEGEQMTTRPDEVEKIVQHARAAVGRLGRERFPDITADLHLHLAMLRRQAGQLSEAEQEALQGVELSRRDKTPGNLRTPNLMHELGQVYSAQGRYDESLKIHQQALEIREKLLGLNNSALVTSYNRVASVSMAVGQRAMARSALNKALALQESSSTPETSPMGTTLLNLGLISRVEGRTEEARRHYDRAQRILERIRGRTSTNVVNVLTEKALLAHEQGQEEQALALASDAVNRVKEAQGYNTASLVPPLVIRSRIHLAARRYTEARGDLLEALAMEEKVNGKEGKQIVAVLLPMAQLALATQPPRDALDYCARARRVAAKVQGEGSPETADALSCMGEARLAMGSASEAVPLLKHARWLHMKSGEPKDPKSAGRTSFLLARAYLETDKAPDRAKALATAKEARSLLASVGTRAQTELKETEAWQQREARP
ncbi:serine/threonine protein kinase [Myxococcus landrumensis]|uniref:Serine/threonine protein kinase n=2 Tax=Myxococcus landrumensis TaxID=2813577 RepID=A0ABX7NLP5_9BACT|nr:serine/threonine protein kinase [Myxococcus landrumus]